jgi:hypothetical protein
MCYFSHLAPRTAYAVSSHLAPFKKERRRSKTHNLLKKTSFRIEGTIQLKTNSKKTKLMKKIKTLTLIMVAVISAIMVLFAFTIRSSSEKLTEPLAYDSRCPAVDPCDHTVLLPNPGDCGSFFMCSHGVPILQKCPQGLHFNIHLNVCDWPQNAGCAPDTPEFPEHPIWWEEPEW